jgi:hypothetical protein
LLKELRRIVMIKELYKRFLNWLYPELQYIQDKFDHNHTLLQEVHTLIDKEISLIEKEMLFYKSLAEQMVNESPDMAWIKDVNGKYIMANDAIKCNLLCCSEPEGKDDVLIARLAREKYGKENHTFGELCANSDAVVIEKVKNDTWGKSSNDGRFYEYGKVKGKMLYLEVIKFPVYVKGELYGVAGFGRDMTPYREDLDKLNCFDKNCKVVDVFKRFEFNNRNSNG